MEADSFADGFIFFKKKEKKEKEEKKNFPFSSIGIYRGFAEQDRLL
jgi:hypothetical protein